MAICSATRTSGWGLLLLFHEPLNPKDVLALVAMLPL